MNKLSFPDKRIIPTSHSSNKLPYDSLFTTEAKAQYIIGKVWVTFSVELQCFVTMRHIFLVYEAWCNTSAIIHSINRMPTFDESGPHIGNIILAFPMFLACGHESKLVSFIPFLYVRMISLDIYWSIQLTLQCWVLRPHLYMQRAWRRPLQSCSSCIPTTPRLRMESSSHIYTLCQWQK